MSGIEGNIRKLNFLLVAQHGLTYLPIWILFLMERGLPLSSIFFLDSIRSLTFILLELPSGAFSDAFGRRRTLLVAGIAGIIGILFLGFGQSFWQFLLASIFSGIAVSFQSGTMEALTYDTLQSLGKEGNAAHIFARQQTMQSVTQAVASVAGGIMAIWSLSLAVLCTIPFMCVALIVAWTLKNPPQTVHEKHEATLLLQSARHLWKQPLLCFILLFHGVFGGSVMWLSRSAQPYLNVLSFSSSFIGFFYALLDIAIASGAFLVPMLLRLWGRYGTLLLAACFGIAMHIGLGLPASVFGCVLIILGHVPWGVLKPITADIVSRLTPMEIRATILSIRPMMFHLVYGAMAPVLGIIAERNSVSSAILISGLFAAGALILLFVPLRKIRLLTVTAS